MKTYQLKLTHSPILDRFPTFQKRLAAARALQGPAASARAQGAEGTEAPAGAAREAWVSV